MIKKIYISIVLVMLLFASTMIVAAKPSDLPEQAYSNKGKDDFKESQYMRFDKIACRTYEKIGWVPQGIQEKLLILDGR